MYLNRRGEIATVLTIAAFVFIGVASLTSSYFLDKPQTTSSSAQTSNRCNPDIGNGMPCSNNGEWCINCLSRQASCNSDAGVGIPFQCEDGVWKNRNVYGECNRTCVVAGQTNPTTPPDNPSTSGGMNPYGVFIDGPGRSCGSNKGGANDLGCGGDDGCRFWEVCFNGGCFDTTSNGTTEPGSNACFGDAGSREIWSDEEIQQYNSTSAPANTNTPVPQSGGNRSCSIAGTTYAHGERYCTAGKDVGQCNDGQLTIYNDCTASLPCDVATRQCATQPVIEPTAPAVQFTPTPTTGGIVQSNFKGCSLLGQPYAHGAKECNGGYVIQCNNGEFQKIVDCNSGFPCNTKTKQCTSPLSTLPGQQTNPTPVISTTQQLGSGQEGDLCHVEGEKIIGNTMYVSCINNMQCADITNGGIGVCKKRSVFLPLIQNSQLNQCESDIINGIKYYKIQKSTNNTLYYLGENCTGDILTYGELSALTAQSVTYKFSKTDTCGISCGTIGMSQIGVSNSSGKCWCWPF